MIVPDNTKQALTIKRVKNRKSESSQPRKAPRKGCGGVGWCGSRGNARRMPRHEGMFTHERANGMSDYANMGAASTLLSWLGFTVGVEGWYNCFVILNQKV